MREAEHVRDGRATAATRAEWLAHEADCPACARAWLQLERLGEVVRQGPSLDPFSMRRLRAAIVSGEPVVPKVPAPRRRIWPALAVSAGALVTGVIGGQRAREQVPPIEHRAEPLGHVVTVGASDDARWSYQVTPEAERLLLTEGTLTLGVTRRGAHRFLVQVPDGELEDIGTVFRIVVADGRTQRIEVSRGAVVFRRPGMREVRIAAGTTWILAETADEAPSLPVTGRPPVARAPRHTPRPPRPPARQAPDNAKSAATGEDALYMYIVSLVRDGKLELARAAGREYLARYPHGFRRVDVEDLTR